MRSDIVPKGLVRLNRQAPQRGGYRRSPIMWFPDEGDHLLALARLIDAVCAFLPEGIVTEI